VGVVAIFRNFAGRIFAVILLSGSLLYQTVVITGTFRDEAEMVVSIGAEGERVGIWSDPGKKNETRVVPIRFNPSVPDEVPDLSSGYIFREDRSLNRNQQAAGNTFDRIDIDDLFFSGSIISDEGKIALVIYQEQPTATTRPPRAAGRQRLNRKGGAYENQKLRLHDIIGGYTVADIFPEKLVLTREDQSVEKYLYDPAKPSTQPLAALSPKLPVNRGIRGGRNLRTPAPGRVSRSRK
jgi:hypothetical protein